MSVMEPDITHIVTAEDLARRLDVSVFWVYREADAGRLPHFRAGSQYIFSIPVVEQVLAERASQPTKGVDRGEG